jgi:hypothetical protein
MLPAAPLAAVRTDRQPNTKVGKLPMEIAKRAALLCASPRPGYVVPSPRVAFFRSSHLRKDVEDERSASELRQVEFAALGRYAVDPGDGPSREMGGRSVVDGNREALGKSGGVGGLEDGSIALCSFALRSRG